jgi:hypothetical protein
LELSQTNLKEQTALEEIHPPLDQTPEMQNSFKNNSEILIFIGFFPFGSICSHLRGGRDQTSPPAFRVNLASVPLCARSVASKSTRPPRQTFSQLARRRKPKDWLAPGHPRDRTPPPLHCAQFAAPFRRQSFVTPGN